MFVFLRKKIRQAGMQIANKYKITMKNKQLVQKKIETI